MHITTTPKMPPRRWTSRPRRSSSTTVRAVRVRSLTAGAPDHRVPRETRRATTR